MWSDRTSPVRIRFIGQPFDGGGQIGRVVADAMGANGASKLWVATAWAKQSGLARIRGAAAGFREAGGSSEVIVGIDEGGATREGLLLCLDAFDEVFVFHDPGARTFHPKIYAVETATEARLLVGSGNLTKGGLFTNYEAAFAVDVQQDQPEWALRDEVREYFERLLGAREAIQPLTAELVERLSEEGWVTSEARQNRRRSNESEGRRERSQLFGTPLGGLAGAPASEIAPLPAEDEDDDSALPPASTAVIDAEEAGIASTTEELEAEELGAKETIAEKSIEGTGFWKRLSNNDASHTSSPGQIQIPIEFLDFFPELSDEVARTAGLGQGQSAAYFPVDFTDGAFSKNIPQTRVILYEPAPHHPRPNREIRFTFHDHEVFERLSPLDVLVFTETNGSYSIDRRDPGAFGGRRWGWL